MSLHSSAAADSGYHADLPEAWASTTIGAAFELNPPKPPKTTLPEAAPVTFVPMPAVDAESGTILAPQERSFGSVRKGYGEQGKVHVRQHFHDFAGVR